MNKIAALLLAITLALTAMGIFILYESSSYSALLQIGDEYFFVKKQLLFIVVGVILSLIISKINYKRWYKLSFPLLILTFVLLIAVFVPGIGLELKGAHRWIDFGLFVLQPSELLKITLTMYLAAWLSKKEDNKLVPFLMVMVVSAGIVAIEPDLGTSLIIAISAVIMYFLASSNLKHLVLIFLIGLLGVVGLILVEPYRIARITSFAGVDVNKLDETSYHTKQVLIAIGSGGLTGVGLGNSVQKYAYLPENTTDSIFAIYAEEAGYIGALFLITLFIAQLYFGLKIATKAPDTYSRLLAAGIISFISIQAIINIGSQAILFPMVGIPLPFISYGGSAMIINYVSIGILLGIARKTK